MADLLLSEEEQAKVQEAFAVFDKKNERAIPVADLATLFQALHCNVSIQEITEYVQVTFNREIAN